MVLKAITIFTEHRGHKHRLTYTVGEGGALNCINITKLRWVGGSQGWAHDTVWKAGQGEPVSGPIAELVSAARTDARAQLRLAKDGIPF